MGSQVHAIGKAKTLFRRFSHIFVFVSLLYLLGMECMRRLITTLIVNCVAIMKDYLLQTKIFVVPQPSTLARTPVEQDVAMNALKKGTTIPTGTQHHGL